MQIIIITPEISVPNETERIHQLLADGLAKLHIRKPNFTTQDYRAYIAAIAPPYHNRLVIHGSYELLNEYNLAGIHLNSAARIHEATLKEIEKLHPASISTSFHAWSEIAENETHYDYVFISPVFDSISKAGYKAAINLAGAKALKKQLQAKYKPCPAIIGLGGVTPANISLLQENGFDGAAMLGAVWESAKAQ
jgi:thiamine-phosphate pyrophosphorylase